MNCDLARAPGVALALSGAALVALAPSTSQLRLPLLALAVLVVLLFVPLLALVLSVFAPLFAQLSAVSAGPVTVPRALAAFLVFRVLAASPRATVRAAHLLGPGLALLAWLAVRSIGADAGRQQTQDMVRLALLAVVVVVLGQRQGLARLRTAFAMGALAFVLLNTFFGQETATGGRWQGLTGNPNLLATAVAVLAPFCLCDPTAAWGRVRGTSAALTYLGLAVPLVIRTQSREGAVLLALATLAAVSRTSGVRSSAARRAARQAVGGLLCLGVLWLVVRGFDASRLQSQDLNSLSGRVGAWAKAWHAFGLHPLVGDGSGGQFLPIGPLGTVRQSGHNAYLSVLGQGGLLAGVLVAWVAVSARLRGASGSLAGAVHGALITVALAAVVGDVHVLETTWALYAMARLIRSLAEADSATALPDQVDDGRRRVMATV